MFSYMTLAIIGFACALVFAVVHLVMVVQGFKTSVGWGFACLLVPLASLVFAITKFQGKGKPIWIGLLLLAMIGAPVCVVSASLKAAEDKIISDKTVKEGMDEFEKATQELDGLEDLQLDDLQLDLGNDDKAAGDAGAKKNSDAGE